MQAEAQFDLSDTQRELKNMVSRLLREHYHFGARKHILKSADGFSRELWARYAELGLLGVGFDEEHGGAGGGFADLAVVMEEFGKALVLEPIIPNLVLAGGLVAAAGSRAQVDDILPQIAAGSLLAALAHGEGAARHALSQVETTARRRGAGYVLDGVKPVILGGQVADLLIVSARTAGASGDAAGITLFLLQSDAPGIALRKYRTFDGMGAATARLDGVQVAQESMLGPEGGALAFIEHAYDRAIAAQCAEAAGLIAAANEITLDYLKTRRQFGAAIGSFQALQHKMVDMVVAHEHARSLALVAARYADLPAAEERAWALSAAKLGVDRAARQVGQLAIQLHGGIGMTEEYAIGHYFRRLTAIGQTCGDAAYHMQRMGSSHR